MSYSQGDREAKILSLKHLHFSVGDQILFHIQGKHTEVLNSFQDILLHRQQGLDLHFTSSTLTSTLPSVLMQGFTTFGHNLLWDYTMNVLFRDKYLRQQTNRCEVVVISIKFLTYILISSTLI